MKFYNKLGIILMLSLFILPMDLGITQANASDNNQPTQQDSNSWDNADNWNSSQIADFFNSSRNQDSDIQNYYNGVNGPAGSVNTQSNGDTTVSISDTSLAQYLHNKYGLSYPNMNKSEGYNKIKWYGPAYNGNVDIYLSKSTIQNAHGGTTNLDIVLSVMHVNTGHNIKAGWNVINSIKNDLKMTNEASGKVYVIRNWYRVHSYKQ